MRTLLLALPLVAGASWAGTTYYAGSQTQPAYDKLISQLNEFKPFVVKSEAYNAGFLSSTAITKVMNAAGPDAKILFRLKHVINHSPVGVDDSGTRVGASTIQTTLLLDESTPETMALIEQFEGQQPFELFTRVGISGEVANNLTLNPFSINHEGASTTFEGGNYVINSDDSGAVTGNGNMGSFVVTSDQMNMTVEPSDSAFDLQRISSGIYSGTYAFNIPMINLVAGPTDTQIKFGDVKISSESTFDGEAMQANVLMRAGSIDAPIDITSASYQFDLSGLSMQGMQTYMDTLQNLPVVGTDPAAMDTMVSDVMEAYKALITPGTGLGVKLKMANSGGAIESAFDANFKGDGSPSGFQSIATIRDLANALDLRLQLEADEAALNKTPAAMLMMHPMASEYLVFDGTSYSADIKVSDLILDVNGNPQSLEDMFGEMLGMPLDLSMLAPR